MSGHSRRTQQKKALSHGWIVVPSKTYPDRVYFYNTVTRCSTWKNPCEDSGSRAPERSRSLSPQRRRTNKIKSSSPVTSQERKKRSSKSPFISPDSEIEDYDEENDEYFQNLFCLSPESSDSSLLKASASDSDSPKHNSLVENGEKELWLHFLSKEQKTTARKSLALSDMNEASTSIRIPGVEMTDENKKKTQLPQSFNKGNSSGSNRNDRSDIFYKKRKSKNRINSESKTEPPKKGIEEKLIKNVCFKKKDKTPAQTRLMKLRKQNAEKLKELAIKQPELFACKTTDSEKCRKSTNFDCKGQSGNERFIDSYSKSPDICNNSLQEFGNYSRDEFNEEMDWEPSSEENDVRNINVFRQQLDRAIDSSSEISFGFQSDHSLPSPSKNHSWFVALDTNIFVSCLSFVKDLRDITVSNLGRPVIYVPWRVLQELDHLKDPKINAMDKQLPVNVRKAITYLNENFKAGHPGVIGQSFEDFRRLTDSGVVAPDDEILQTCINFQKENPDKKLMLLTNDKNLQSKAIVSGVETYSKDKFQKKFLTNASISTSTNPTSTRPTFNNPITNRELEVDKCLCEIKSILKEFLPLVVETEMKIAFEGDWVKLAFKKPPWNLQDALECMLKHWRSVFFLVFSKDTHFEAQKLYERLYKKEPGSIEEVIDVIKTIQRLFLSIKRSQKKKKSYTEPGEVAMGKLSSLLNLLSPNHSSGAEVDIGVRPPLLPSVPVQGASFCPAASQSETTQGDVERIKNLFKDIWDSLRSFCCTVSDAVHSPGATASMNLQQLKLKMSQVIAEVTELVFITERIFEANPTELHEEHTLIAHFSSFLVRVYPTMDLSQQRELPKCLVAFFNDFEGRSLLSSSLKDFKEFSSDLIGASEYFNARLTG